MMPSETSCDLTVFSTPCPWHQHGVLRWRLGASRRASDRLLTDYLPGGKSDANTARRAKDPGKVFGAALPRGLCQNSRRLWRVWRQPGAWSCLRPSDASVILSAGKRREGGEGSWPFPGVTLGAGGRRHMSSAAKRAPSTQAPYAPPRSLLVLLIPLAWQSASPSCPFACP